jgi:hypothetical protein
MLAALCYVMSSTHTKQLTTSLILSKEFKLPDISQDYDYYKNSVSKLQIIKEQPFSFQVLNMKVNCYFY